MIEKLGVLFLVKNLDDVGNVQSELKKINLDCTSMVTQSLQEFKNALQGALPDLIIADYNLADGTGIEAFQIKSIVAPQTPFIMIAESVGEDAVMEFMKMGVADYVRKGKINQIGPSIQQALQKAAIRKQKKIARQQVKKKAIHLKKIMDFSPDVICMLDKQGRFVSIGAAAEAVWGYLPKELMGFKALDLIHPEDRERCFRVMEGLKKGVMMANFENRFIRKDGGRVFLSWSVRWDPKEQLAFAVARDVSKIKQAEQAFKRKEKRYRTLLQISADGLSLLAADGTIIERSPSALKILGFDPEEVSNNFRLDLVHPDDLLVLTGACAQIKDNPNDTLTIEYRFQLPDGKYIWLESTLHNQLLEPVVDAIVVNFRDITKRKTAEMELRESEAKLKKAQALGHCGSWELNLKTGQAAWSDEMYRIFAFEDNSHEASFESFQSFIHPEDLPGVMEIFEKAHAALTNGSARFRLQPLSGGILYVVSEWQFDLDAQGLPVRIFGVLQDVTQSKLAEIALSTSEARLKHAQAIGHMGSWEMNLLTGHIIWSDELFHIYGLNQNGTTPSMEVFKSILHPEEASQVIQYFEETSTVFRDASSSFRIRRANNGEIRHVNSVWQFELDAQGKPLKVFGIVQDITDRKLADQALEKSEEKYRNLFNFSPTPMWLFDVDTLQFIDVNEAALMHYGYSRKEFFSMTLQDIRAQAELGKFVLIAKKFKDEAPLHAIVKHVKKDGKQIDVEINSNFLEVGGRMARLVHATDISERMKYLEAIQQQNFKLKQIAWTQSHVVRAPLARLMGLVRLLRTCNQEPLDAAELLNLIEVSAQELDGIIRNIVQKTEAVKDQTL